jgi:ribose/xylose/arabinose/galactoside ABC-type transport system permease subunit
VDATVATKLPEPSQAGAMAVFFVTAPTFRQRMAMTDILESASVLLIKVTGMTICLIADCLDLVGENGFLF